MSKLTTVDAERSRIVDQRVLPSYRNRTSGICLRDCRPDLLTRIVALPLVQLGVLAERLEDRQRAESPNQIVLGLLQEHEDQERAALLEADAALLRDAGTSEGTY